MRFLVSVGNVGAVWRGGRGGRSSCVGAAVSAVRLLVVLASAGGDCRWVPYTKRSRQRQPLCHMSIVRACV